MAIYSRFGDVVTIERMGKIEDVREYDRRRPDKYDRHNVSIGNYVIIKFSNGKLQLASISYLRADDGFKEIAGEMRKYEDCPLAKWAARGPGITCQISGPRSV